MVRFTFLTNGFSIRLTKKKVSIINDTRIKACLSRFDAGYYTRMQFLPAVSHSVGGHTDALQPRIAADASTIDEDNEDDHQAITASPAAQSSTSPASASAVDCCEVCLTGSRNGDAFVSCGYGRFCSTSVHRIIVPMCTGCPICHDDIYVECDVMWVCVCRFRLNRSKPTM